MFYKIVRFMCSLCFHYSTLDLVCLLNQLLSSTELIVDHIVTLDYDEYDDSSGDYQQEDKNDISSNIVGIKYSYDTMCAIVEYSTTHTFTSVRRRYKKIKYEEQLHSKKKGI
jgi:hypothetical protein